MDTYDGKVAFITGAAGGLGLALARALGQRGAKVMLADVDQQRLSAACNGLIREGVDAAHVVCDVSDADAVRLAATTTIDRFGKVHFAINNAGVSLGGPTGDIAIEDWNWIVNINLMGVVHGVEAFTPILAAQGEGGHILNTASMAGHLAITGGAPYTATKYAVVGYSESIRQELAPQGIGVSVLCPGWVRTAINETSQGRPSLKNGGKDREVTDQGKEIADAIANGLEPADVAEWTLSQIDANRFYIFTHPELQPFVEGRFAEIKADMKASHALPEMALSKAAKVGSAPLDVLIIGAGFSGVCAAIQLQNSGIRNFHIYDKSDGIGGTWWRNTYPGAACDVPSHFYCYSFEMNPEWTRLYAPQPEIQGYIENCADKYGVRDRISLGRTITSTRFDVELALWITTFEDGATVQSRFVVNAAGGLHKPLIPNFPGRGDYAGAQMHTAEWDHGFDPAGKRIAVIGSAASAIQTVPQVAKTAAHVTLFQRTPNHIAPREDFAYSAETQAAFRADSGQMTAIRDEMLADRDTRLYPLVVNPAIRQLAANDIKAFIRSQIEDPVMREALIPEYELGCKRILISDDFYPALNRDNVSLETSGVARITTAGIETGDGDYADYDAIIYATGFDLEGHKHGFEITGADGVTLAERWRTQSDAYKAAMAPGMPNYFMVTGPNAGVGTTSVIYLVEQSVDWIVDAIKTAGRDKLISVTAETCQAYSDQIQAWRGDTVWASGCESWYISPNGRIETLFPGNAQDFANQMRRQNFDELVLEAIPGREATPRPNWTARREDAAEPTAASDFGGRTLDPTIKAYLNAPAAANGPRMWEMSPSDARLFYAGLVEKLEAPISIPCEVENHAMDLPGRSLNFRIYRPSGKGPDMPAMVYYHGGGWVIGDLDTHDKACRALSVGSGLCVVSVDYRCAPEHPCPAASDDAYDACCWMASNGETLGLNTKNLGIGGDSAGGNIAAAATHRLRDSSGPHCAWQVLIYPSVAADQETASLRDFAKGFGLDAELLEWFGAHYIPAGAYLNDPRLSPLSAESLARLPPALIFTAGFDPLRDSGCAYADRLRENGVQVHYKEYEDLIHGFQSWAGIIPSAGAAVKDIARAVGELAKTQEALEPAE